MHPRLTSVDVGGRSGSPVETKDVTNTELARRIAFIFREAAREKAALEEKAGLIEDAGDGRA
jgi:hypothetical protein